MVIHQSVSGAIRYEYRCANQHMFEISTVPGPAPQRLCGCGRLARRVFSAPAVHDNCIGQPYFHAGLGKVVSKRSDIARGLDELNEANPGADYGEVPDFDAVATGANRDMPGIAHDGTAMTKSLTKDEWGDDPAGAFGE